MRQPPMRQPGCSRRYVLWTWLVAVSSYSYMYVAATAAAGAPAHDSGYIPTHSGVWETAFSLAMLALLAGIAWATYRGRTLRKSHPDVASGLLAALPICMVAFAHTAGWWSVSYVPSPLTVAVLSSVGAVLSAAMFGVYCDVYRVPRKEPFQYMTVLVSIMATATFAYHVIQVADDWGPQDITVALQSFAAVAMVGTAVTVAIFSAEYVKNRRQSLKWTCILLVALVVVGVATYLTSGVYGRVVGDTDDMHLYVVQAMWAGVTVAGAVLGAGAMLATRAKLAEPAAAKWRPISHWVWLGPTMVLAGLAPSYHDISGEWVCFTSLDRCEDPPGNIELMYTLAVHDLNEHGTLRPWIPTTMLLAIWNGVTAMVAAMLGDAVAARIKAERTI